MSNVLSVPLHENLSGDRPAYDVDGSSITSSLRRRIPLFVPGAQLYYWTNVWQRGELEALHDIEAGNYRIFPDGASAAQWLLSDED